MCLINGWIAKVGSSELYLLSISSTLIILNANVFLRNKCIYASPSEEGSLNNISYTLLHIF